MSTKTIEFPRLFEDIRNLDDHIRERILETITGFSRETPAIVSCKLELPPGDMFRLPGEQYGVYLLTKNEEGETVVQGMRTEPEKGAGGGRVAKKAMRTAVLAFSTNLKEHNLSFPLTDRE